MKITKKITGCAVVKGGDENVAAVSGKNEGAGGVQDYTLTPRPERLTGATYKIKTPMSDHATYVTINDLVTVSEKGQESKQVFEIFINSKNTEHFQWMVALTRVMSAIFRKGDDPGFLIEELESVFDPAGGYFKKGGKYVPSLVAEIGGVVKAHLQGNGLTAPVKTPPKTPPKTPVEEGHKNALLCPKCNTMSLVKSEGCFSCLNCAHSKCA